MREILFIILLCMSIVFQSWIPQWPTIFDINVWDEVQKAGLLCPWDIWVIRGSLSHYASRALIALYHPEHFACLPWSTGVNYRALSDMISHITWIWSEQRIIENAESQLSWPQNHLLFLSEGEWMRRFMDIPHRDNTNSKVTDANSKSYLRKWFGRFMVPWGIFSVDNSWNIDNDAKWYAQYLLSQWKSIVFRIPRSATWLWVRIIWNQMDLDLFINELPWYYTQQAFSEILIEEAIPWDEIVDSPSCQCSIWENGEGFEIFWWWLQVLESGTEHIWNIQIRDLSDPLIRAMKKVAEEIWKKYSQELSVHGLFGLDFMLVKNPSDTLSSSYPQVKYQWETMSLILCEVNWRMTGSYPGIYIPKVLAVPQDKIVINQSVPYSKTVPVNEYDDFQVELFRTMQTQNFLYIPNSKASEEVGWFVPTCLKPDWIQWVFIGPSQSAIQTIKRQVQNIY